MGHFLKVETEKVGEKINNSRNYPVLGTRVGGRDSWLRVPTEELAEVSGGVKRKIIPENELIKLL